MGIEPKYCNAGPSFFERQTLIGFRGALHEHRKIIFDRLKNLGIQVDVEPGRLSYENYMKYLQTLKFFIHDESQFPWVCNGKEVSRSTGMWIKSVETAARGTFCLRNYHHEGEAYNVSQIPLIICYEDYKEVPDIVKQIQTMPSKAIRDIQHESVSYIRSGLDWLKAAITMATGI
jgi:hypothetical protein